MLEPRCVCLTAHWQICCRLNGCARVWVSHQARVTAPLCFSCSIYKWQLHRRLCQCEGSQIDWGQALIEKTYTSSLSPFRKNTTQDSSRASGQNMIHSPFGSDRGYLANVHSPDGAGFENWAKGEGVFKCRDQNVRSSGCQISNTAKIVGP